ncbi:uncharacterized protein LOC134220868 isoform X2 [Armigeres subalbatus]|uniref:uncharacterized protein LOC134220868 isoform X2 n=1 Tax=Armigeres subalbatus TaxID=124917 RepID=UPI002ED17C6F
MSKPSVIKANRISRDSGICVEDSPRSDSPGDSPVKKRFPAGGGPGTRPRVKSSYVLKLTQHFETLSCHDEGSRSSPATLSKFSSSLSHLAPASASDEQVPHQTEVERQVSASSAAESEVKMDDAVQVIEHFYNEILVEDKRVNKFGILREHSHSVVAEDIDQPGDHLSGKAENDENMGVSDKITDGGDFHNESSRDFEMEDEPMDVAVAEARNISLSQEPADHEHYYEEDDFSATDSFDSSDDEDLIAVSKSRPDSDSSIKSERISNIMKELLENEETYVQTLEKGIENYISVMNQKDLPPALRGQKYHIFGNIESIFELHNEKFLPKLRDNSASIQGVAETFIEFIEYDRFYCYILFALNRPNSEKICNKNLDFFQERQNQVGDKLGLNSFLLQPIQRLMRYKLLLAEINKEALKLIADALMDSVKDEIGVLCKAEKRLERFIDIVNEAMSINDICECYELNIFHQGKFRKMFEMDIYDWDRRRKYASKVFFFEKCLIYSEKIKEKLEYRGHYLDSDVGLYNDGKTKLCVFEKKRGIREIEISSSETSTVQRMAGYIEDTIKRFAMRERQRVNDLSSKKEWCEQRVPSVMTINRGSVMSGKSIISNNSSRDSYDSGSQTTWDAEKPIQSLVSSQKHFCQILAINRKHYFGDLPDELSQNIKRFIQTFDQLVEIHSKRVYEDFAQENVGLDDICELFIKYFQEDLFDPYNKYLKLFKKAADVMKNIHKASRTSLSSTLVAQTTDDFTFMPIDIWNKYEHFVQSQIVRLSEQMDQSTTEADKDLFRKLAYVEVQINSFRKLLMQNYKLLNLDANISASSHGLVLYSVRVRYGNETLSSHRVFICEKAVALVRVQMVKNLNRTSEKYTGVVFQDKFVRGVSVVKQSKKSEMRLNFEIGGIKHAVDFGNKADRDKFFGNYSMFYGKWFTVARW